MSLNIQAQLRKVDLIERYKSNGLESITSSEKKEFADAFSEYVINDGIIVPSRMRMAFKKVLIECVETKEIYTSAAHLAKELGISEDYVCKRLKENGIIKGKKYRVI